MRHQLVALLSCSIQAHGIIYPVIRTERNLLITSIHRAGRGIHQMFNRVMSASFKDIV